MPQEKTQPDPLCIGAFGPLVKKLQLRLISLGIMKPGEDDGDFGPDTESAVKEFQRREGIAQDGVVGPKTQARLSEKKAPQIEGLTDFQMYFLAFARSQVGIREKGSNAGPVEKYLKAVGLSAGEPYCLAGLIWCADKAAEACRTKSPLLRTGHCQTFLNWAKEHGYVLKDNKQARPGDIGIMKFGGSRGHAYCVEINQPEDGGTQTIEFNSNDKGSRDGEGVVRGFRLYTAPAGIVRIPV